MTKFYIKLKKKKNRRFLDKILVSNFRLKKLYYFFKYFFYSKKTRFNFKLNKKDHNLVIGAVYGMKPDSVEIFLNSLRKFYKDDIALIGTKADLKNFSQLCKTYKCCYVEDDNNPLNGFINRYRIYLKILNKFKFKKNILLSDTRDVYFQNNPLKNISNKIFIGAEKNIFFQDHINSSWVEKFYNFETLFKLKNKQVLCSGVISGKAKILKKFIYLLIREHQQVLNKFRFKSLSFPRGSDNTTVNYCYYLLCKKENFIICGSIDNRISTLAALHESEINVKNNKFLTSRNKLISIIHQYDRYFKIFKKK